MHTDPFKNFIEAVTLKTSADDPDATPRRFLVTERDVAALLALAKHRYLMTHQVKSLIFAACVNPATIKTFTVSRICRQETDL